MIPYVDKGTYLFRFMSPGAAHFWPGMMQILTEHKLFLNSRTNFNDPYDSRPIIIDDLSHSALKAYFNDMVRNPFNPKRTASGMSKIFEMRAAGRTTLNKKHSDNIKRGLRKNSDEYLDKGGLISFSLSAENPLLWGHYAASFSGICLVFRRGSSTRSALSVCAKVNYVERRPFLPLSLYCELAHRRMTERPIDDVAEKILSLSFFHKSNHWAYEREARALFPFYALETLSFEPSELAAIIIGPKSSPELESKIRCEVKAHQPTVSIYNASLSQSDFKIVIPHIFTRASRLAA
jgi:hypothetical protein